MAKTYADAILKRPLLAQHDAACRVCNVIAAEAMQCEPCNEVLSPCACRGSLQWICRACLDNWRSRTCSNAARCELCRSSYSYELEEATLKTALLDMLRQLAQSLSWFLPVLAAAAISQVWFPHSLLFAGAALGAWCLFDTLRAVLHYLGCTRIGWMSPWESLTSFAIRGLLNCACAGVETAGTWTEFASNDGDRPESTFDARIDTMADAPRTEGELSECKICAYVCLAYAATLLCALSLTVWPFLWAPKLDRYLSSSRATSAILQGTVYIAIFALGWCVTILLLLGAPAFCFQSLRLRRDSTGLAVVRNLQAHYPSCEVAADNVVE